MESAKLDKKEWYKLKYKKTLTNVFDLGIRLVSTLPLANKICMLLVFHSLIWLVGRGVHCAPLLFYSHSDQGIRLSKSTSPNK